ncbi:MAG: hypothetical protein NT109_09855 [Flavobacteriia bacterium]|nr:hypothetical protein [Flavobacteriia bacterium]
MLQKSIYIAVICLLSYNAQSQVSLNLGLGPLKGFGVPKSFFGFHGGIELPRNNDVTFYLRLGYYLPKKEEQSTTTNVTAIDLTTSPYNLSVSYLTSTNYTTIEGGTRYYLGNDYDNGFSIYGGSNFMLILNSVKRNYEKYDLTGLYNWENDYVLPESEEVKGTIISVALGLQGGVKYTFPARGTIYADITGSYALFAKASNNTAANSNLYAPMIFIFNVGFRKDLY